MAKTARETALLVLERFRRDRAFSDSLIAAVLADSALSVKDRALVSRLAYGVLQNTILLDFYIDALCGGRKLEPTVRDILRLSLYQILFLDKIPNHAAVSEGVQLVRKGGRARAAGLVNAVLRRAADGALPEVPRDDVERYLSIKYSTPLGLAGLFVAEFGAEFAEGLLAANNAEAPLTVRVNTLKTTRDELLRRLEGEGVSCEAHELLPEALNISASGGAAQLDVFKSGLFYVQDAAAMLAVLAADPQPDDAVLDVCAAPGGKSFACAMLMEGRGRIVSCDVHENKLGRVVSGADALGIEIIDAKLMDATEHFGGFDGEFDCVIADAPCSGLGVIRKKPDIRYKNLAEIADLPALQLKILENAAFYVKNSGILLYSTCTVLRRENEDVVSAFLAAHSEFSTEGFSLPEPVGEVGTGMVTLFPHVHGTDGFFICKLRKNDEN